MSEEEKKAIESIKFIQNKCRNHETIIPICSVTDLANAIDTVLHLVENQQKEIEKYQGIEEGTTIIYKSKAKYVREDRIEKYYIDKNKIREKIKELENCIDKPIVKLKVLQHGFTHEANTQFIIKTIINILSEILGD